MSNRICLACCYLPLGGAFADGWRRLHFELQALNLQLVMLTRDPAPDLPFPAFAIPLSLREYRYSFPVAAKATMPPSVEDRNLASLEDQRWGRDDGPESTAIGVPVARAVLQAIIEDLQPTMVLIWDDASALSSCLRGICRNTGVPVRVLERGLLPGTMMVESEGIAGLSEVRTGWLTDRLDPGPDVPKAFEHARCHFLATKPQKYAQPDFGRGADGLRAQLNLSASRVVVFFGHIDAGFCGGPDSPLGRHGNPAFASTPAALNAVWEDVRNRPDTALIFKPHPHDHTDYTRYTGDRLRVVREANIHALIELADVVVAQYTTIQFEVPFYDKPVVLLARSQWWGRDICYEVDQASDLAQAMEAALARDRWAVKAEHARQFIVWLLRRFLVAWDPASPASRGISEFAAFLARWAGAGSTLAPVETRLRRLLTTLGAFGHDCREEVPLISRVSTFSLLDHLQLGNVLVGQRDNMLVWQVKISTDAPLSRCLVLHPQTKVTFQLPTGASGRFRTAIALHPEVWSNLESGACQFLLSLNDQTIFSAVIDPVNRIADRRWHPLSVELPPLDTGVHRVTLETRGLGSQNFRWALWREPRFEWLEANKQEPEIVPGIPATPVPSQNAAATSLPAEARPTGPQPCLSGYLSF